MMNRRVALEESVSNHAFSLLLVAGVVPLVVIVAAIVAVVAVVVVVVLVVVVFIVIPLVVVVSNCNGKEQALKFISL